MFIDPRREVFNQLMADAQVELVANAESIRDKAWEWATALRRKEESITPTEAMYCPQTRAKADKVSGGAFAPIAFKLAVGEATALLRGEDPSTITKQRMGLQKVHYNPGGEFDGY